MYSNNRFFFVLKVLRWLLTLLLLVALFDGARQVKLGYRSFINQGLVLPDAEQVEHYPLVGHIGNACLYEPEACEGSFDIFGWNSTGWTLGLKDTGYLRLPTWIQKSQDSFSVSFGVRTSDFVGKKQKPLFLVFAKNRAEQLAIHWVPSTQQLVTRSSHQETSLSANWRAAKFAQVTLTVDPARTKLFVNGELQGETKTLPPLQQFEWAGLQLGGPASQVHFDNVILFSRALSELEVQQLSEQLAEYRRWFPFLFVGYFSVVLVGLLLTSPWTRRMLFKFARLCSLGLLAWMRDIDKTLEKGGPQ